MKSLTRLPIKEYALGIYDGPHATPSEVSEGPVFLGIKNITEDGRLDFSEIRHVSENEFLKWTRRVTPQPGDVALTYEATLHRYAVIPEGFHGCLGRRVALVRPNPRNADSKFLLYYFLSREWRSVVERHIITGATVDRIPLEKLPDFPVIIPKLPIQKKIASVLTAYDDLIENNRRRMALLENAARLLYEEWFVRLRFPGHEHTRIIQGLPEKWTRKPLEQVAEFRLGKMLDQVKNRGELMPYLANLNVRWGSFDLCDLREMRFEHDELETYGLKFGDIVMCEGGEPGRCAIWKEQLPQMMIQKALHRIRCRSGMNHEYLYQCIRNQGQSGLLATLFTGATIKHLPREKLAKVTVVVPPAQLMEHFVNYVRPMEKQLGLLVAASKRASEARDILLPRLMSGEIEM